MRIKENNITITREEALTILKNLSIVEGFLWSVKDAGTVIEIMDYSVDLLTKKLVEPE